MSDAAGWIKRAMRFIDLCDADAAGYDELHEHAEKLTAEGFALFGLEGDDICIADLERASLAGEHP